MEISRTQVWQWLHHKTQLAEGLVVTRELVDELVDARGRPAAPRWPPTIAAHRHVDEARDVFAEAALGEDLPGFFTPYAYVRYLIDKPLQLDRADHPRRPADVRAGPAGAPARLSDTPRARTRLKPGPATCSPAFLVTGLGQLSPPRSPGRPSGHRSMPPRIRPPPSQKWQTDDRGSRAAVRQIRTRPAARRAGSPAGTRCPTSASHVARTAVRSAADRP